MTSTIAPPPVHDEAKYLIKGNNGNTAKGGFAVANDKANSGGFPAASSPNANVNNQTLKAAPPLVDAAVIKTAIAKSSTLKSI